MPMFINFDFAPWPFCGNIDTSDESFLKCPTSRIMAVWKRGRLHDCVLFTGAKAKLSACKVDLWFKFTLSRERLCHFFQSILSGFMTSEILTIEMCARRSPSG